MALLDPSMFGDEEGGLLGGMSMGMGGPYVIPRQQTGGGISPDMLLALGAGIAGGKDWGSGIGAGLQGALGAKQKNEMFDLKRQQFAQGGLGPATVREYQFAQQNGFKGSFEDWILNKSRGDQKFGLQPVYAKDPQGNLRAYQLDSSGGLRPIEFGDGMSPAPAISNVDLGTSIQPTNTRTGLPAAPALPVDVGGKASQTAFGKVEGEATATAQVNLPKALDAGNYGLKLIDEMIAHPGRATATGASGTWDPRNYLSGTDAKNFQVRAKQVEGQAFLDAFESLKGAGAVTEIEGQKATQAKARLDRAQSDEEYVAALHDLQDVLRIGMNRARQKAGQQMIQYAPRGQVQTQAAPFQRVGTPKDQTRAPSGGYKILSVE